MRTSMIFSLGALGGVMLLCGCRQAPVSANAAEKDSGGAGTVRVVKAWQSDLTRVVEVPFTVDGYESAALMVKIDGYVKSVNADLGDHVSKNQVLATLNVPELDDDILRNEKLAEEADAQIKLAAARTKENKALVEMRSVERNRIKQLVGRGSINQEKLDEAQFALASANAALARAEAEVDAAEAHAGVAQADIQMARTMAAYREIRAPFDGLISERAVDVGEFVRPAAGEDAESLFEIVRVDKVRIVFHLPMDVAGRLDQQDTIVIDGVESQPGIRIKTIADQPLTIARFASSFNDNSRMMRAEVDVDNQALTKDQNIQLRPGEYGRLLLTMDFHNIPVVPASAVGSDINGRYVLRLDENNTCHKVRVDVCIESGDNVGLEPGGVRTGDRLVAADLGGVSAGESLAEDRIQVVEAPQP